MIFGEKIATKYADDIIVLSKGDQKYFKEKYNRETIFIENGVNKPQIVEPNIINQKWGLEKDSYLLYLGRIVPEKGLHYLIDAFKNIQTDKKLVIAGGASHTNEYFNEIKEKASTDERIIMTGFAQGQILEELFSNAYLYCMPSDIEGMPISLLEAMSYGNQVLTSDIEECTQVLGDYGYTFKKADIEDLKNMLEKLLKRHDTKSKEIGNYILSKYNWDDVVAKTVKVYNGGENK